MGIVNGQQAMLFLYAAVFGIGLGMYYDCFRILRILVKWNAVWVLIQDLVFFLSSAFGFFLFLFFWNNGEIRIYVCLASALGMTVYFLTLGRLTVRFAAWLKNAVLRCVRGLARFCGRKRNNHVEVKNDL